ncbi:MAG: hypothetical protein ABIM89_10980 [Mycobacteriales bacterium]
MPRSGEFVEDCQDECGTRRARDAAAQAYASAPRPPVALSARYVTGKLGLRMAPYYILVGQR